MLFGHFLLAEIHRNFLLLNVFKGQVRPNFRHGCAVTASQRVEDHDEWIVASSFTEFELVGPLGFKVLFSGLGQNMARVADNDQVPMRLLTNREDEHAFLEDVDLFGPPFDFLVGQLRPGFLTRVIFAGLTSEPRVKMTGVDVHDVFELRRQVLVEPSQVKVDDVVVQELLVGERFVVVLRYGLSVVRTKPEMFRMKAGKYNSVTMTYSLLELIRRSGCSFLFFSLPLEVESSMMIMSSSSSFPVSFFEESLTSRTSLISFGRIFFFQKKNNFIVAV